jgi:predicted amino acid dehydrogenase
MKKHTIAVLHLRGENERTEELSLLGEQIEIRQLGCGGDLAAMADRIRELDGKVDAIALQDVARSLRLGHERVAHEDAARLFDNAEKTPVVDGSGVRDAMERWAVRLADKAQPGIWSRKRILMSPGLNRVGLAQALAQYSEEIRYADPFIYMNLPSVPGVGSVRTLNLATGATLSQLQDYSFRRLFPQAGTPKQPRSAQPFEWADVIAGSIGAIRRYAPRQLTHKTVVVENASDEDVEDLKARGVSIVVTTMPSLGQPLARLGGSAFEACLVALRKDRESPLTENTYLNLMADLEWTPAIRYLQPEEAEINRFAFVIHPLKTSFISKHPAFKFTRYLPDVLVENIAANIPPIYISRIRGIQSPTTGQKVEGILLSLGATPKELMRRDVSFTYRRLIKAARMAERMGARLMGLGAFTSVVGDAGITVAQKSDIAITSGNSLTVAATLETAKEAAVKMGHALESSRTANCMVIGATGSIGSVCSRLLAQAIPNITLVAPRPEKLISLKRTIEAETPGANVRISTSADEYLGDADLIVTTTTAIGQRIIDIVKCKPGAVICDIARPPDITEEEAALRPDVLVIESGEILLPGNPDFGYDIGLPPGVAYACLAETALLAMEGRFEDYTLGRNIDIDRVKEIYQLYKKHGLKLSGIRSHDKFLTDEDIAAKRKMADQLRANPDQLAEVRRLGAQALEELDGRHAPKILSDDEDYKWAPLVLVAAAAGALGWLLFRRKSDGENGEY